MYTVNQNKTTMKFIESIDLGISKVLVYGKEKYLCHGVLGESAVEFYNDADYKSMIREGEEILKLWETVEAAYAYWSGLRDGNGWNDYEPVHYEDHMRAWKNKSKINLNK